MATSDYAAAIHAIKGPDFQAALTELVRLQACARCCVRFSGIRTALYASPAPTAPQLLHEYLRLCGIGQAREGVAAGEKQDNGRTAPGNAATSQAAASEREGSPQGATSPQPSAQDGQANGNQAVDPTCSVCLGVLQSLDGPLLLVPEDMKSRLCECDGGGSTWQPVEAGNVGTIAQHVRGLGYPDNGLDVALELSVPASTQLRQLAMWYHLRETAGTKPLFSGQTLRDDVVDLKETLRLRGCVAEPLAAALDRKLDPQNGELRVTINYIHPASASESEFLYGRPFGGRSQRKRRKKDIIDVGRASSDKIADSASGITVDKFKQECCVPPLPPKQSVHVMVACRRLPLYVGGNYRKLQRDVSQSPWTVDGQKKGRTSVQEEIQKVVLPLLNCDSSKFITAGREDMDVRMLGNGRPFVLEIQNQHNEIPSEEEFEAAASRLKESNVGVEVLQLRQVSKDELKRIKEGEQHKQKSYRSICELPCPVTPEIVEKINSCKGLRIEQDTPTRVARRRADLTRVKMVHTMTATPMAENQHQLVLELRTQAGTYIKEFVHGDEGRTNPNLGSFLGCSEAAKILQLDVMEVHMDGLSESTQEEKK